VNAPGEPIRSYQRIFRPERRIYRVEGHAIPVPGGVPLRWLAYASAALVATIALGSGSAVAIACFALAAASAGLAVGGREGAVLAGIVAASAAWLAGLALGLLDWPLRLLVIPAGVATLATQATPDGRRADRFAASWLALRLAPARRSLGRAVPAAGAQQTFVASVWVAPDERSPALRHALVRGPATLAFAVPVSLRRSALRRRPLARPARAGGRAVPAGARLALGERAVLEVRP
jgi:hypothetical protein